MDLLRLHLQNFTSYQNQVIDLQNLHVVGLLGANGSGKSSFIEAIVWALYGEGTKGSRKSADNYVRIGTESCMVTLDFFMSGHIYRVVRGWDKKARKGTLALFVYEKDWVPKGKNATEIQLEIEHILGMDYQTFIATAVSPQGESGSFTNCSDADRKTILGYIMNLVFWDRVQKKANITLKSLNEVELRRLSTELDRINRVLDKEEEIRNSLDIKARELRKLESIIREQKEEELQLQLELSAYKHKAEQRDELEKLLNKTSEEYDDELQKLLVLDQRAREQLKELDSVIHQLKQSIRYNKELLAKSEEINTNHEEYIRCEKVIKELEPKVVEYQDAVNRLSILKVKEEAWREDIQRRINDNNTAIEQSKKSCRMLDNLPCCGSDIMSNCPLIEEAVANAAKVKELEAKSHELLNEANPYLTEIDELENKCNELYPIVVLYNESNSKRNELEQNEVEFAKLSKVETELTITEERLFHTNKIKRQTKSTIDDLEDSMASLSEKYEINVENLTREIETINLDDYDNKSEQLGQLSESIKELEYYTNELREEVGALRIELVNIEAERENYERVCSELSSIKRKIEIYKVIEKASSRKGGVPALVIENAIPEIERIANELLIKVTDRRFSVKLETQIESKTTDSIQEVLRIFVLDDGIARPYQTYSGAQKFILDLSLRVAVCKFLARRTGKEVKILIIDEGFSALDGENLPKVMEAIYEIAGDFNKLFIVTHIQSMKDALPHRVYFSMTPSGTKILVEGMQR